MVNDVISSIISGGFLLLLGGYLSVIKKIHDEQTESRAQRAVFEYKHNDLRVDHDNLEQTVNSHGERIFKVENKLK